MTIDFALDDVWDLTSDNSSSVGTVRLRIHVQTTAAW